MRKAILTAALLPLIIVPAFAQAGGSGQPSLIEVIDVIFEGDEAFITGQVNSTGKCEKGRTVELYDKRESGAKVLDTDTTSDRGAFAVIVKKADKADNLFVRVLKSGAGNVRCGSDKAQIDS